jgi:protocatechuate 3,4-dioxygenase beta subunit
MALARLGLLLCGLGTVGWAGTISGTVVDSASGDAVRKASVTVTWHGTPRAWATTRTDGSGKFIFEGLPAGTYDLRANKNGLGVAIYGANSTRELGETITLADGETRENLKLRFLRTGTVSGRVVDADGDPVTGTSVTLLRSGRNPSGRVLSNYRGTNTDDRGEYKIPSVDPGEYYLYCSPNRIPMMAQGVLHDIPMPQYYSGARDAKDAIPVNVRTSEVLSGIDFRLTSERPAKITGRLTGVPAMDPPAAVYSPPVLPPTMSPEAKARALQQLAVARQMESRGPAVTLELSPADDNGMRWSNNTGVRGPDYHFELPEQAPGRYRVQASIHQKDKVYFASQVVDAGPGTNDIVVALLPGVELKGHLKVEGAGARPLENYSVALTTPGTMGNRREAFSSPVKKDGSFTITQVPPGEWQVTVNPSGPGTFEKSMRLGDKDFLYKPLEIPSGLDVPLNIVITSGGATIDGEVEAGTAAKRAGILLAPMGARHTMDRFYSIATTDDKGKFKINGVAPGKYKLFALEGIATANFRSQDSADLLDALGEELDVPESGTVQPHPKLILEERAREILKP